jgi:hypothetical protein
MPWAFEGDDRNILDRLAELPDTSPEDLDPVSGLDNFAAPFQSMAFSRVGGDDGLSYNRSIRPRAERVLSRLAEVTGDTALMPVPGDVESGGVVRATGEMGWRASDLEAKLRDNEPRIRELKAQHPDLMTLDELYKDAGEEAQRLDRRAAEANGLAGFVGGTAARMLDPIHVLAEAGVQAVNKDLRERMGIDDGWLMRAQDLTYAAGAGAVFGGAGHALGAAYRAAVGKGLVRRTPRADAAANLAEEIDDALSTNPARSIPETGEIHLRNLQQATEDMNAGRLPTVALDPDEAILRSALSDPPARARTPEQLLQRAGDRVVAATKQLENVRSSIDLHFENGRLNARIGPIDAEEEFAERLVRAAKQHDDVQGFVANRVRGDALTEAGGRPFKTRAAAEQFARQQQFLDGPFRVDPEGRGFVARLDPEGPIKRPRRAAVADDAGEDVLKAYRAAVVDGKLEPSPRLEAAATRVARRAQEAAKAPVRPEPAAGPEPVTLENVGRFDRPADPTLEAEAPVRAAMDEAVDMAEAPAATSIGEAASEMRPGFQKILDETPDREVLVDLDAARGEATGVKVPRRLKDVVSETDRMKKAFQSVKECMLG